MSCGGRACACADCRRRLAWAGSSRRRRRPTIGDALTDSLHAQLASKLSSAGPAVQGTIAAQTGLDLQNQRVSAGAQAAASLAANGFDPNSSGDQQKLVDAIAGGLTLIPGAGPLLGAATEAVYQIGSAIACPVTNAFASIGLGVPCNAPVCRTSGHWTPQTILAASGLPRPPKGSFAELVEGALAFYAAKAENCAGGFSASDVVDAAVAIRNHLYSPPAEIVFVPPLYDLGARMVPGYSSSDPNIALAFAPWSTVQRSPLLRHTDPSVWNRPAYVSTEGPPFVINDPTASGILGSIGVFPPRLVSVNTRPPRTLAIRVAAPAPVRAAAPSSSTGATTAVIVSVLGLGAAGAFFLFGPK